MLSKERQAPDSPSKFHKLANKVENNSGEKVDFTLG